MKEIPRSKRASAAGGGVELEVKFATDPQSFARVVRALCPATGPAPRTQELRTSYFDTRALDLWKNSVVLRFRKVGRARLVQSVKISNAATGSPHARAEIEVRATGIQPNLSLFDQKLEARLAKIIEERPLEAQVETRITRRTLMIKHNAGQIEVAFDEGSIEIPGLSIPLTEIELELKSGNPVDLYDFAAAFAQEHRLTLDMINKGEKGFRAASGERPAPVKAIDLKLPKDTSLARAVEAVTASTISQFLGNWAPLREADAPDAIHQLRVSLRRLRSSFNIFKRSLPYPEFEQLGEEAKRLAATFGPARMCDVFHAFAETRLMTETEPLAGGSALLASVEQKRNASYQSARAMIDHPDTTVFVLRTLCFGARLGQSPELPGPDLPQLAMPATDFARGALSKLHARVLKRGKGFSSLSPSQRHSLRIALKNLRYGISFFGSLFAHKRKASTFVAIVEQLQELLGAQNDAGDAKSFVDDLSIGNLPDAAQAAGYVIGWHANSSASAEPHLKKTWKQFKRAEPFWN